jgi:holo-[acyl-carrier protein] synthase
MLNLGVDIVSIDRIQSILNSDKELRFLNKIFSEQEIAESENKETSHSIFPEDLQPKKQLKRHYPLTIFQLDNHLNL